MAKTIKQVVHTGTDIITGQPIHKEMDMPAPVDYSEGRKLFPVHASVDGMVNNRVMKLVPGHEIYLNPDELRIFRMYVSGEGK